MERKKHTIDPSFLRISEFFTPDEREKKDDMPPNEDEEDEAIAELINDELNDALGG